VPLPTTADDVWKHIEKWPFAVLGFVTPKGEPRAAGVDYTVRNRTLYVLTGPDTWKARHIRANPHVSVTVTIQRLPIRVRRVPPAVISFAGLATVLTPDDVEAGLLAELTHGLEGLENELCVIRIVPTGRFVTYGIGVPPMKMRTPKEAIARVPVV